MAPVELRLRGAGDVAAGPPARSCGDKGEQVRWDQLFADLEAQLEAEEARDLRLEVADRIRRERAQVGLAGEAAGAPVRAGLGEPAGRSGGRR